MVQNRERQKRLIVRLRTDYEQGSGVLIKTADNRLFVLTALHCLTSSGEKCTSTTSDLYMQKVDLYFFDHQGNEIAQLSIDDPSALSVPSEDPDADLALLVLPNDHGLSLQSIEQVNLCSYWNSSERYLLYGFPKFIETTSHANTVFDLDANFRSSINDYAHELQASSNLSNNFGDRATETVGGMSGGGVFLGNGLDLVGIIGEFRDERATANRILVQHFENVESWLSRKGLSLCIPTEGPISQQWLESLFQATKSQLDTRYTPEYHVKMESEKKLDAFFLTPGFKNRLKVVLKKVVTLCENATTNDQTEVASSQKENLERSMTVLRSILENQSDLPHIDQLHSTLKDILKATDLAYKHYKDLQEKLLDNSFRRVHDKPHRFDLTKLEKVNRAVDDVTQFLSRFQSYDKPFALVQGPAGAGKSHLLATMVEKALKRGQIAILFVGEQFTDNSEPFSQMMKFLDWEKRAEGFLEALNDLSSKANPSIIAIDALNESSERRLWKSHLNSVVTKIKKFPNIRLLISCRSDFAKLTLPPNLENEKENWTHIDHHGFEPENLFEAVKTYFNGYKVKTDHFPPLLDEFQNPLFLKIFSETYENSEVPNGSLSLSQILERRVDKCALLIREAIDCPPYITRNALNLLAEKVLINQGNPVPYNEVRPEIDGLFGGGGESKSLYTHLRSNGMIVENYYHSRSNESEPLLAVRFPYERFSDYFMSSKLLAPYQNWEALYEAWSKEDLPKKWIQNIDFRNRGLLGMFAISVPEKYGIEFIQLFPKGHVPSILLTDMLDSLLWRTPETITPFTLRVLKLLDFETFFWGQCKLIAIPDHPLNAWHLHNRLKILPVWRRELEWTVLFTSYSRTREAAEQVIDWAFSVPLACVSVEQAQLTSLFLAWLLSSNDRFFRTRASLALVRILTKDIILAAELIEEFHFCNDPYIVERVYAGACGAALRSNDEAKLKNLAAVVFSCMFERDTVPPHILQRSYAQTIIEYVNYYYDLPDNMDLKHCRPPYNSKWPSFIAEKEAQAVENQDGWWEIKSSLQPEETGTYGDFGRYVMDSNVHCFSRFTFKQVMPKGKYHATFSGMKARRYILKRIKQLGWTPERFGKLERNLSGGRMNSIAEARKTERFGKKYQWIALHELLGYIADRYQMKPDWGDKPIVYEGPWQLYVQDLDPSQPIQDLANDESEDEHSDYEYEERLKKWVPYPDPFADKELCLNRKDWVEKVPNHFSTLIEFPKTSKSGTWLNLFAHYDWREQHIGSQSDREDGTLKMWTNIRCWLIPKDLVESLMVKIEKTTFYGNGCFVPGFYNRPLGTYPWSPGMKDVVESSKTTDGWLKNLCVPMHQTICQYSNEDQGIYASLPGPFVCELLKLKWSGCGFEFINAAGVVNAYFPTDVKATSGSPLPMLIRKEPFLESIDEAGYSAIWATLSERTCWSSELSKSIVMKTCVNQRIYRFESNQLKCIHDKSYGRERYR